MATPYRSGQPSRSVTFPSTDLGTVVVLLLVDPAGTVEGPDEGGLQRRDPER